MNQPAAPTAAPQAPAAQPPAAPPPLPPAPDGFLNVFVNGHLLHVKKGRTVMQACTQAGQEIPHFCYHERLSIAGNCRMCLVEIEGMPKPVASCHWPIAEGMRIRTDSKITQEARKGTMELLLINHPLDCPICDQGGECDLQDQAVAYGADRSHFNEMKRAVDDKDIGAKIKTVMTRCIHCTRCIRFATEIAGVEEFGATGRGENMQVGTYVEAALQSELAGNMIDLCPVGALTSKPYAFAGRPWELVETPSVDVFDGVSSLLTVHSRSGQVMRVLPREDAGLNEEWCTDAARFSYDAQIRNRLTTPLLRKSGKLQPVGWPEALAHATKLLKGAKPAQTAVVLGAVESAETAFSAAQFAQQVLKNAAFTYLTPTSGLVPGHGLATRLADLTQPEPQVDGVLLIGCNPRWEAPMLNLRLRQLVTKRRVPVHVLGPSVPQTYATQSLGEDVTRLATLANTLPPAQNRHVFVGQGALNRPDAALILAHAAKLGTVNVLPDTLGRSTALMLLEPTRASAEILADWQRGTLKTLWLHGDDTFTAADLQGGKGQLIYCGTHRTALADMAELVLPLATHLEQSGTFVNAEGRLLEAAAAVPPPMNAKEGWKIYRALSEDLGATLPWNTLAQLRAAIPPLATPASTALCPSDGPPGASPNPSNSVSTTTAMPGDGCIVYSKASLTTFRAQNRQQSDNFARKTDINATNAHQNATFAHSAEWPAQSTFYLKLEYLRQSHQMHLMQTEAHAPHGLNGLKSVSEKPAKPAPKKSLAAPKPRPKTT